MATTRRARSRPLSHVSRSHRPRPRADGHRPQTKRLNPRARAREREICAVIIEEHIDHLNTPCPQATSRPLPIPCSASRRS
jgi:hypothetical protein